MSLTDLHTLGEHKFRSIGQQLRRGVPASSIAQLIQHEWGDCLDVEQDILIEELESLRTDLSTTSHAPKRSASQANGGMHRLSRPGHGCLDELVDLADDQADRIKDLLEREASTGCIIPEIDILMARNAKLVRDIQEIKFHLGIDTYLRRVPEDVRARLEHLERQKQENERQCYEAYEAAEEIFKKLEARRARKVADVNSSSDASPNLEN